jgi:hypothetical protein
MTAKKPVWWALQKISFKRSWYRLIGRHDQSLILAFRKQRLENKQQDDLDSECEGRPK